MAMADEQSKGGKHGASPTRATSSLTWYVVARRERGVKESIGLADNPRIVEYHAATTLRATDDEVPWCSSFVNWCVLQAGYKGTRSAAARSWMKWGTKIDTPVEGCIVVLTRLGGGHVGFYVGGHASGTIHILGGNQSDSVRVSGYLESRVLGYFMPTALSAEDKREYERLKAEAV